MDKQKLLTKTKEFLKECLDTLVFVIIAVIAIRFFIGELRWIPSGSMKPTLVEKDRVFVEKVSKPFRELSRGDVVVFYPPDVELQNSFGAVLARLTGIFCKDIAYIKRIVGTGGDKFEVKQDKNNNWYVYINDIPLKEDYIFSQKGWSPCTDDMYCGPFVIPQGQYFMMGDNRGNSQDSRYWGFLPEDRVIGRAFFLFWPLDRIKTLKQLEY